ncbi:MAG TPA: Ger(x)C family spore germination protein, partial [Bacilli bacterium]|nr:Ger(x)C family spore germination protein [Bacilli bacterium]
MRRKWMCVVLVMFCTVVLSGCWDRTEIEEHAFIVAVGLDKGKEKDQVKVTYQIANPPVGLPNTGGKGKEKASAILTFPAPDFLTARDLANATLAREISFAHAKVLIVSEELARTGQFWREISAAIRDREIRREMNVIVSKEDASEFIRNNDPSLETRPHKYYDFMSSRWAESGLVPDATLQRLFQSTETKSDAFLGIYATTKKGKRKESGGDEDNYLPGQVDMRNGKNNTQLIGSAVFVNGKMKGTLSGEETRLVLGARPFSKANLMYLTYKDPEAPDYRVSLRLVKQYPVDVNIDISGKRPIIRVNVNAEAEVVSIPSGINYVTDLKQQQKLERSIEQQLNKKYEQLINRTQEEFERDLFHWSLTVRKKFWTVPEFEKYNWSKRYAKADIKVNFHIRFRDFGKQ